MILYLIALVNSFINYVWYRYIMSCANKDSFTSLLFLIWMHFISISCLTVLAKTSNICWLNVLREGIHVFFLILAHLFTIKYARCGLLYMTFIKLSLILFYIQFVKSFFNHKWMVKTVKLLSVSIEIGQ